MSKNRKIIQFIILGITLTLILLTPYFIETGIVPVKNKMLAYFLIFLFMIGVSFLVSWYLKRSDKKREKIEERMKLYNYFIADNNGTRIKYDLARFGVDRSRVSIKLELNKKGYELIEIRIKLDQADIILDSEPTKCNITIVENKDFSLSEEGHNRLNEIITENLYDPNTLVLEGHEEVYRRVAKAYKEIIILK